LVQDFCPAWTFGRYLIQNRNCASTSGINKKNHRVTELEAGYKPLTPTKTARTTKPAFLLAAVAKSG